MENKSKDKKTNTCVVCGAPAPNGPQCKICYYESKEFKDQIDKNEKIQYYNSYYYNLNGNLYRMTNFDRIKSNCNKLIAISMITKDLFNSDTLSNKVFDDVSKIISKKQPKAEQKTNSLSEIKDSQQERLIATIDGHYVKSQGEVLIDNILYNRNIVHAYSPIVVEIDNQEEQAIEADWFIPVAGSSKGIYIEYWGMNTENYLENKKRKKEQYEKNDIPVIYIEKNEPLEDPKSLETNLISNIKRLAKHYYRIDWQANR